MLKYYKVQEKIVYYEWELLNIYRGRNMVFLEQIYNLKYNIKYV